MSFEECDELKLTGHLLDYCRGERGTLAQANHMRAGWGLTPLLDVAAPKPVSTQPVYGPGTELKRLLHDLGFSMRESCGCNDRALRMNAWGIAGCRERRAEIEGWLREAAADVSIREKLTAGIYGILQGINPLDPFPQLVDLAIERAERNEMDVRNNDRP